MRTLLSHPAPDERGFILVGVVTFMLALTILGLSLFALSSYEAQFFVVSAAREQSLQNSESGMELVKALIAAPGARLEDAHRAEGQFGITHAFAYQWRSGLPTDTTSSGLVIRDSSLVIVVAAKAGSVERTLQATFIPGAVENPYQRLLAAGLGISVNPENSTDPSTIQLSGRVWHPVNSDADTAWTAGVNWRSGQPIQRGTPPMPDAKSFVEARLGSALLPASDFTDESNYQMTFPGGTLQQGLPVFFSSPNSPTKAGEDPDVSKLYTFYAGADMHIFVRGTAVWLVPAGVCFKDQVLLRRVDNSPSTLVIVAEPGSDANRGICFKGGLQVLDNNLNVYLVSNGDISVIHHTDNDWGQDAKTVSIVAGGHIELGGPEPSNQFKLFYDPSTMDALADLLLAKHALPPVLGGTGMSTGFVAVRPSWVETTPR